MILIDFAAAGLQNPEGFARLGMLAQKWPVIVLIDEFETDRLANSRDLGIKNWLVKETLTPSRLADAVRKAAGVSAVPRGS
ncbi:MAG TPA: hypothetical protein VGI16_03470 [Candidatus Acidoferrum sp.]|jgi:DNA-binding NarL/FixJ family response regulator